MFGKDWKSRESTLARGGCRHPRKGRLKSCAESHEHVLSCSDFITRPSQGMATQKGRNSTMSSLWPMLSAERGLCLPIQRRGPGQDVTEMGFKSRLI